MYKHFILTRFNLREKASNIDGKNVCSDMDWLNDRLVLFEKYCLPSVAHQSQPNFTWIIFFDTVTPEPFREKISRIEAEYPFMEAVYIDALPMLFQSCIDEVKARLTPEDQFVITSRIDNDDAIHEDYIASVQAVFDQQEYCHVDCLKGYSFSESQWMLATIQKPLNPFASLIEKNTPGLTTIWGKLHAQWGDVKDKIQITHKPLWLQVIHSTNISNQFGHRGYLVSGGYLTDNYSVLKEEFHVAVDTAGKKHKVNAFGYNVKVFLYHVKRRLLRPLKKLAGRLKN